MKPTDIALLRIALEAKLAMLEDLLRNRDAIALDHSGDLHDQLQYAAERDQAIGNLERDSDRLREVRAALRRIQLDTFAVCLECENPIGLKRLEAVPWAAWCLACMEVADGSRTLPRSTVERPFLSAA